MFWWADLEYSIRFLLLTISVVDKILFLWFFVFFQALQPSLTENIFVVRCFFLRANTPTFYDLSSLRIFQVWIPFVLLWLQVASLFQKSLPVLAIFSGFSLLIWVRGHLSCRRFQRRQASGKPLPSAEVDSSQMLYSARDEHLSGVRAHLLVVGTTTFTPIVCVFYLCSSFLMSHTPLRVS